MMKTSAPRHQAAARGSCSAAAALQRGRLSNGRPQQQQRAIAACAAPSDSNPCSTSGRSIEEASLRGVDRRALLGATLTLSAARALGLSPAAQAFVEPPQGFRVWTDKLDGYSFVYPDSWLAVTVTGNDCFFRNPRNVDENLFVDISSPSSSFYNTVTDLGTPDQTAKQILSQYLDKEFMSTRLGIRREGQILSASSRQGEDGRTYFDVAIRMTSFASRSPYLATQVRPRHPTHMLIHPVLLSRGIPSCLGTQRDGLPHLAGVVWLASRRARCSRTMVWSGTACSSPRWAWPTTGSTSSACRRRRCGCAIHASRRDVGQARVALHLTCSWPAASKSSARARGGVSRGSDARLEAWDGI